MRVIQVNAVYKISSTGRICLEIHDYLKANGHECITIYGNSKCNYPDTVYVGNIFTQKIHALFTRITGKIGYFSFGQTKKVIKCIKGYKPDVVHLHNLHANYIAIPKILRFLGENNIPTVVTLHDCFFYTGGCTHYTVNGCFKWEAECEKCKFKKQTWFFDRTKKMFNDKKELFNGINNLAVVGVSDWIIEEAKKSPVFVNAKVFKRIYNGIDLTTFIPRASNFKETFGITDKKIILGVASSWSDRSDRKGLKIFCKLADKLREDEIIVLVGDVKGWKLSEKIISVPSTSDIEQLVDIYNAADVFVQASKEETFGKVVAEALACGVPVVTNNSTANPELVNEKCGIVCGVNPESMYNAIEEVLSTGKNFYSENCIAFAKQNFDNSIILQDTFDLYDLISS